MEPVRHVANICVGRAVLFGSLAIVMLMVAFSFHPVLAFKCGAITTLLMSGILTAKALHAHAVPPRRTEAWLFLDERARPSCDRTNRMFSTTLREVYAQFARVTLFVACGFFAVSLLLHAAGVEAFAFAAG